MLFNSFENTVFLLQVIYIVSVFKVHQYIPLSVLESQFMVICCLDIYSQFIAILVWDI